MPLPEPLFEPRKYRDILNEAVRRIGVHNPEWNNYNDSDPGITVLQVFAFMFEDLGYRANRIPERNRQKFLRLLGIEMRAPQPARGIVSFSNANGPLVTRTLEADQVLRAGVTPFRTENGLDVLPVEAAVFYKSRLTGARLAEAETLYFQLYASFGLSGQSLQYYETKVLELGDSGTLLSSLDVNSTVDGLWLALFARQNDDVEQARREIANKTLTLGILPALDSASCIVEPEGAPRESGRPTLLFERPSVQTSTGTPPATYARIPATTADNPLIEPAVIQLTLPDANQLTSWTDLDPLEAGTGAFPPSLEDDKRGPQLISWIRIRLPQDEVASGQVSFEVSWIGINAARIIQKARVTAEILPRGTGEPDQTAVFANTPVLVETVTLTVNGEAWQRIDDLNAAGPEVDARSPRLTASTAVTLSCSGSRPTATAVGTTTTPLPANVFTIDRESGEIRFGDGLHGTRPPAGATILASYDYGGGVEGNVGIGSVNKGTLPSDIKVSNPVPTWGGAAGETVPQAEKRIPGFVRHHERLVSDSDFREVTMATPGVSLARVEVLPLFLRDQPLQSSLGVVTVMVIPATDPRYPNFPTPDRLLLQTVCEFLAPRRLVTTELHVEAPNYIDIWVSIAIQVIPGRDEGPVREAVQKEIENFLSAISGGFAGTGWPLNSTLDTALLAAAAARAPGVATVTQTLLGTASGQRTTPLTLTGLDLPRLVGISVISGTEAAPIDELLGTAVSETQATNAAATPVPVVPETC